MNLLDTVKGYLGDETIGRVASTLGIDPGTAKSAIGAAAPTLLAGVAQTANSGEEGARRVAAAVDGADEAAPENFSRALTSGGAEVQSMTQSGASMLSNLFGRNMTGGFVGAISRYTGLGAGVAGKLIGLVTPVVFGALKRQKTSMGLDAGGLANLLSSQKSSFLSAIPSGLSGILSSVPGLSTLTGTAGAAAASARGYAAAAGGAVRDTGYAAARAGQYPKSSYWWVGPAVLCAVVLIGLWWWMGYRAESERRATVPPPRQQPAPTVATPAAPAPEDMASQASARIGAGADTATGMTSQVSDVFTSATGTFGQVRDAASAEAAVPKVEAINERLGAMSQSMKALPADGRTKVSASVRQWREKLRPVTDKALAAPGAGEKLRPAVDEMYKKMDAMTAGQ